MSDIYFSQVREDPNVELAIINKLFKNQHINILMILSGGCSLFSLLNNNNYNITCVDQNQSQLYLVYLKIAIFKYYLNDIQQILRIFQEQNNFDISLIKHLLSPECYNYWINNIKYIHIGLNQSGKYELLFKQLIESNYDYSLFSRNNLINIFGEIAVMYSNNISFEDHFKNIINYYQNYCNIDKNYYYHQIIRNKYNENCLPHYFNNIIHVVNNIDNVKFVCDNFVSHLKNVQNESLHIIQTSNITDWMNIDNIIELFVEIKRCLTKDGVVIMRRLISDINLKDIIINTQMFKILGCDIVDTSYFYTEVVIAQNI